MLQTPKNISALCTVTELRSNTTEVKEQVDQGEAVLVVKNNEPYLVAISLDEYQELIEK